MLMLSCDRKYKMPPIEGESCGVNETKDLAGTARSVTTKASLELPVSAVAGLQGEDAEQFEEYADNCERAIPSIHCWTPTGDVLIGCSTGELLKVVTFTLTFTLILICLELPPLQALLHPRLFPSLTSPC